MEPLRRYVELLLVLENISIFYYQFAEDLLAVDTTGKLLRGKCETS